MLWQRRPAVLNNLYQHLKVQCACLFLVTVAIVSFNEDKMQPGLLHSIPADSEHGFCPCVSFIIIRRWK